MTPAQSSPAKATSVPLFSDLARYRAEAPTLQRVTVRHDLIGRHGDMAPLLQRVLESKGRERHLRVLDIGAYDRALGRSLERIHLPCKYSSLDIDDSTAHDFNSLDEVNEVFDVVGMFELIEHLSYEQVGELFRRAYDILSPDGILLISTPNPSHAARYFSDVSHTQHWPPNDLFALLRHHGFAEAQMFGVIYMPSSLVRTYVTYVRNLAWRLLGFETCGGILAIARKGRADDVLRGF